MGYNPVKELKDIIKFHLDKIEGEDFRFNLFFRLSRERYFLFNIYDSRLGFVQEYKGLQITASRRFIEIIENYDEFESFGEIVTNRPFLYGNFIKNSAMYIKKIYIYNQNIGVFEFMLSGEEVGYEIKKLLVEMINSASPYLLDVFVKIRRDVVRRYFSINTLNIIRNARPRTFYHSFRVSDLSIAIAKKMGLSKESQRRLCYAALVHDIGEMYVPRDIFYKEGDLTPEEFELIKQHPGNLRNIFAHNPVMSDIVRVAYFHHERMDGKGYYGYKKDDIPIESRILALCETVDGLYTDRPGRKGFGIKQIIEIIKESAINVFDEDVAKSAIEVIEKFYIKRDFDLSMLGDINNVGKPVTIIFSREGGIALLQGAVEYATSKAIGIALNDESKEKLAYGEFVRVQFPFFDIMYDFKASVISFSGTSLNLMIKSASEASVGDLSVIWEFEAVAIPLKLSGRILEKDESLKQFVILKVQRFGSKSLSAVVDKSKDWLKIGDTVIIKMKPLNDTITIPAVVTNIVDEYDRLIVYFEYFNLSENIDAKIHRAIFYKQSKQSVG